MAQDDGWHALELLVMVGAAGGFGGFVDGLITKTEYVLRLPHPRTGHVPSWAEIDFGTVGDILIGAAASMAIFVVAGGLMSINVEELSTPNGYLRLIGLGVLAGFSGLRLLGRFSRQLVEDISKKTADANHLYGREHQRIIDEADFREKHVYTPTRNFMNSLRKFELASEASTIWRSLSPP